MLLAGVKMVSCAAWKSRRMTREAGETIQGLDAAYERSEGNPEAVGF